MPEPLLHCDFPERGIAVLTFHNPDRLNAMTEPMGQALCSEVSALRRRGDLRAAILTGAGRAFSAGGDLGMIASRGSEGAAARGGATQARSRSFMRGFYDLFLSVRDLECPTIAALNGHAIGAGLCVALACDLRIAARDAKLGLNFVRLGIHPGMGATWTLPRLVGPALAAELLFTGRIIDGAEAARCGLVNRAVAREDVLPEALALAREIAGAGPLAVRGTKQALARSANASLPDQLGFEAARQAECYETADLAEGIAAAREKRSPVFEDA